MNGLLANFNDMLKTKKSFQNRKIHKSLFRQLKKIAYIYGRELFNMKELLSL